MITYKKIDNSSIDELNVLKKLRLENPNLTFLNADNELYFALENYEYIGAFSVDERMYEPGCRSLSIALLEEYKKQGLGTEIVKDISGKLIANEITNSVVLEISPTNLSSIRMAIKAGFKKDEDISMKFQKEGYKYIPYSRKSYNKENNEVIYEQDNNTRTK